MRHTIVTRLVKNKAKGLINTTEMVENLRFNKFVPLTYERYINCHYLRVLDKTTNKIIEINL